MSNSECCKPCTVSLDLSQIVDVKVGTMYEYETKLVCTKCHSITYIVGGSKSCENYKDYSALDSFGFTIKHEKLTIDFQMLCMKN